MRIKFLNRKIVSTFWVIRVQVNQDCEIKFLKLLLLKRAHPILCKVFQNDMI